MNINEDLLVDLDLQGFTQEFYLGGGGEGIREDCAMVNYHRICPMTNLNLGSLRLLLVPVAKKISRGCKYSS